MPFDFDDDQMSESPRQPEQPAATQAPTTPSPDTHKKKAVRALVQATEEVGGYDSELAQEMDEIEQKMAKAQYYWELMGAELLDPSDPLAVDVQNEVHQFLRQKLAELMGTPKKRKKLDNQLWRPTEAVKRTLKRPAAKKWAGPAKPLPPPEAPTPGSTSTGEEIVQSVVAPDGSTFERVYRKFVDTESGKEYYMAYAKDVTGTLVSDGNKYELAMNASGGRYFRVWSQQTLPASVKGVAQTKAQLESESSAHAAASMAAMKSMLDESGGIGKLLGAAISLAQKEE